jgi:hypothetical protein
MADCTELETVFKHFCPQFNFDDRVCTAEDEWP